MYACVCMCVYICIYKYADSYKFIQDPELSEKSDPDPGSDPKKIIPDPQHCCKGTLRKVLIIVYRLEIANFLRTFCHVGIFNPAL